MPGTLFDHLRDLHDHMAWADALWFHAWAASGYRDDDDLRQRVHHMALTQSAFLQVLDDQPLAYDPSAPLPGFEDLKRATRENHEAFQHHFQGWGPVDLGRQVVIPWFPGSTCRISVDEVLTQVALHTQHHRGQLMTRLKHLGGKPLNVDYIIWAWKGRPAADWG